MGSLPPLALDGTSPLVSSKSRLPAPCWWFFDAANQVIILVGLLSVSNEGSIVAGIAGRYATALFDLAVEDGAIDAVAADFDALGELLANHEDFGGVVRSPLISREDQGRALAAVLEKAGAHVLTRNFIALVAEKRRLGALGDIIRDFGKLLARHRGEVSADVISAQALSDAQSAAISDQLRASLGQKVKINATVDASLIGGLIVKVGSRMIDSSLATRLANLERKMKEVG